MKKSIFALALMISLLAVVECIGYERGVCDAIKAKAKMKPAPEGATQAGEIRFVDFTAPGGVKCRLTAEGAAMWRVRTARADGTF
ncbi:MAG: hypothetical protein J6Q49_07350, partial [Kiritimatiellae bacterium]|nr:hypothetical protein [Kiritimatiellia bacterium]